MHKYETNYGFIGPDYIYFASEFIVVYTSYCMYYAWRV